MENKPYDKIEYPDGIGRTRHGSPAFYQLLTEMAETHDAKSHDYASNSNPFGNYEFAGILANMFSHSAIDAGFVGRLGEKIYRLHVLEGGNKIPLNESIADTERDIAVIAALWMAARKDKRSLDWNQGAYQKEEAPSVAEQAAYSPEASYDKGYLRNRIDREMSRNEKLDLILHLIKTT